ncbi:MAG: amidohydrolase [Lentisphaerae bacterium]|nr:amidohydrolase [Lentisphaerota bacterium]
MKDCVFLPDYPVIDCHMHPYLCSDRDFPFQLPENYQDFFAIQAKAGIKLSCGSFNEKNAGQDPEKLKLCNERVLQVYRDNPAVFYPGVNVSPLLPDESCAAIEKFHRLGFRWVGELAWYVMGYEKYSLPGMDPICDLAADLGMVINLHPSTLEDLDELLGAFPDTTFVIAHPESAWGIMPTYELAEKHPNMYLDLSGSGLFRMGMLRKGIDMLGDHRILFGTDYPICNPGMNVAGVMFENLSGMERKNIFSDNFIRLTGFSFRDTASR